MRLVSLASALALCACAGTHEVTTVRVTRTLDVLEMVPTSLPEDPAQGPKADRVVLVTTEGRLRVVNPTRVYRRAGSVVIDPLPNEREELLAFDRVRSLRFESETSRETSRHVSLNPAAAVGPSEDIIVVVVFGSLLLGGIAGLAIYGLHTMPR